jgi:ABC-type multidrug transport system fused ATPase/permease subunit
VATSVSRASSALVFGALLLGAGLLVQQGAMSIPSMLAVYATIALMRAPLNTLGLIAPQVQEGWHAWRRVVTLLGSAAADIGGGGVAPTPDAVVELDGVACRYGERVIFEDVSFAIGPGEVVALTGPNGAGKTTLIRQIVGLSRPSSGAIRVGGVDLADIDLAAWRRLLGVVVQEAWLFDGSIRDNLVYGAPHATAADVNEACRLARATTLLRRLPQGLETVVGAGGLRLSDGQRQRLAIARALVRAPRLLILDEPTNHLDRDSATAIIEGILAQPHRPAVLLVTHALEFTLAADRVYVLADGHLTSSGPATTARS